MTDEKSFIIQCGPDGDVEGDVRFRRDGVVVNVEVRRNFDDVPGAGLPVVGQVHVVLVVVQLQAHLEAGIRN